MALHSDISSSESALNSREFFVSMILAQGISANGIVIADTVSRTVFRESIHWGIIESMSSRAPKLAMQSCSVMRLYGSRLAKRALSYGQ
jgi:hypothetical protein